MWIRWAVMQLLISTQSYLSLFFFVVSVSCITDLNDASAMYALRDSLINSPSLLGWNNSDPCSWPYVGCTNAGRVVSIEIDYQNLTGSLPPKLAQLTFLNQLDVASNRLSGPLPSLAGLSLLQYLSLSQNNFSSIPSDFFLGMNSLEYLYLDHNPFSPPWTIPDSLQNASSTLTVFTANSANIAGKIPDFLGTFSKLGYLQLAFNSLEGRLPPFSSGSLIRKLLLNSQTSHFKLNGSISDIQNMTQVSEVWLSGNNFSGPLPDISSLTLLVGFFARDNAITGPVPDSFVGHPLLTFLNLTNNLLQGPTPKFGHTVLIDMENGTNSFCLSDPGVDCDPTVNVLLSILQPFGYPAMYAESWKGNDPCSLWMGITCDPGGNVTIVHFHKMGLTGTISPDFSSIVTLVEIDLSDNNLTGNIPNELTTLTFLRVLDVSNNRLFGKIPRFRSDVVLKVDGNPNLEGHGGKVEVVGAPSPSEPLRRWDMNKVVVVGLVIGGSCAILIVGLLLFYIYMRKTEYFDVSHGHAIEPRSMVISIQILKIATNNFNQENILGKGGFGTVYKGELQDGTKIAVKRMESMVLTERSWDQFKSEISILSKVRHRNLLALLGYCMDGNERLLVYEYMPQGTLSKHLFKCKEEGSKPLEWVTRLSIALDVARGVEYLHGLAHQSFIHRDLKPSNILLGDDMRAKVADFGFVRLAPNGKFSITQLAGTFGYLAPEYAVTGRVTVKVDVFSFGVILMQLITGRTALVETRIQQEECVGLATWFHRMRKNKDKFHEAIDPTIELHDESLNSINVVANLASHCCAKKSSQRPDMRHVVNVLSSLIEPGEPLDTYLEEGYESSEEAKSKVQKLYKLQKFTNMSH